VAAIAEIHRRVNASGGYRAAVFEENQMKLKMLLIACILMLSVGSMLAQSTDSLSGTWKGDMGPSATTRIPLIVEMKLNDQRGVSGGGKVQWSDAIEKGAADKATLTLKLKQATDACNSVYGGAAQVAPLIENIEHTNLHYGNVITYLRMMGLTPPSS
jgi:hypothetical protein